MKRWWWAALVVIVLFTACGGGAGEDDNGSETFTTTTFTDVGSAGTVGAAGGSVTSDDGKLRLDIPAGALTEETQVEVVEVPAADVGLDATALTGAVYELLPDGMTFSAPVSTVRTLSGSEFGIPDDEVPFFHVFHGGGETWEVLSSETSRDGDDVIVRADITHFTFYFLTLSETVFGQTVRMSMSPSAFTEPTGGSRVITTNLTIRSSDVAIARRGRGLVHTGALSSFEVASPDTATATCGDSPGDGTYTVTFNGGARDESPEAEFIVAVSLVGGLFVESEQDFRLGALGKATCTKASGDTDATGTPEAGPASDDVGASSAAAGPIASGTFQGRHWIKWQLGEQVADQVEDFTTYNLNISSNEDGLWIAGYTFPLNEAAFPSGGCLEDRPDCGNGEVLVEGELSSARDAIIFWFPGGTFGDATGLKIFAFKQVYVDPNASPETEAAADGGPIPLETEERPPPPC